MTDDLDQLTTNALRPVLAVSGLAPGRHVRQLQLTLDEKYVVGENVISFTIYTRILRTGMVNTLRSSCSISILTVTVASFEFSYVVGENVISFTIYSENSEDDSEGDEPDNPAEGGSGAGEGDGGKLHSPLPNRCRPSVHWQASRRICGCHTLQSVSAGVPFPLSAHMPLPGQAAWPAQW